MYDLNSLIDEVDRMEKNIKLFQDKIDEMREKIIQYKVWIKEIEARNENS